MFHEGNDLPYSLYVPTYAAIAHYHGKHGDRPLDEVLAEAEEFASRDLPWALSRGARLSADERADLVSRLARLTGLSESYVDRVNLRIEHVRFFTELLREQGDAMAENMYRMVGDWMRGTEVVLPNETLEPGVLEIGDRRLHLLQLLGHTGADLAVLDESSGVLFAGDILFHQRALTTPNSPGLEVWLADLDRLEATPWKLLVPGHGPLSRDSAPFEQMRDYLGWLDGLLRDAAASGADMNEVIQSPIPERFSGISLTRYELIRSVSHLYPKYEAGQLQRVDE